MQVKTISYSASYERLISLGNYENAKHIAQVTMSALVGEGEEPGAALDALRALVLQQLGADQVAIESVAAETARVAASTPPRENGRATPQLIPQADNGELFYDTPTRAEQRPQYAASMGSGITEKQLKALYAIGRGVRAMNEDMVDAASVERFGRKPWELSKSEASTMIDLIKEGARA